MPRPVAGYLGYDATADRPLVKLATGTKLLLTEDDAGTPPHADTHGAGGSDPITSLGNVAVTALRSEILSVAYAAAVTLDCTLANDFAISFLSGNLTINFANAQLGNKGSVIVRQGAGNNTVSFNAPSPFVLTPMSDLSANSPANAFTIYEWEFTGVSPTAILAITKLGAASGATSTGGVSSEFWAPPAVAHPNSDEFTGAALDTAKWTLCKVSDWSVLTSAGNVDSTSSPATGTVRVTQERSRLYIQPALGMQVAIRRAVSIPAPGSQFSARLRVPVPLTSNNAFETYTVLTVAVGASTPDMTNRVDAAWINLGANNLTWQVAAISANNQLGVLAGPNYDLGPVDAEFRILVTTQNVKIWLVTGGSKHYVLNQNITAMSVPSTVQLILRCNAENLSQVLMPAAPIFDFDYVRVLDSINVY